MQSLLIIVNNAIGFKAKLCYIKYSHYKKRNNYEIEVLTKGGNHIAICKCIKSTTWTLLKLYNVMCQLYFYWTGFIYFSYCGEIKKIIKM